MAGVGFQVIATGLASTEYLDAGGLSTSTQPYRYRVRLLDGTGREIASSNTATSIFLTLAPRDRAMLLQWEQNVPWINDTFFIYRSGPNQPTGPFVQVGSLAVSATGRQTFTYLDQGLQNDQLYCYYVLSRGSYGVAGLRDPLWNASNIACDAPRDTIPPLPARSYHLHPGRRLRNLPRNLALAAPDSSCGGMWAATEFTSLATQRDLSRFWGMYRSLLASSLGRIPVPTFSASLSRLVIPAEMKAP